MCHGRGIGDQARLHQYPFSYLRHPQRKNDGKKRIILTFRGDVAIKEAHLSPTVSRR